MDESEPVLQIPEGWEERAPEGWEWETLWEGRRGGRPHLRARSC